MNANKGCKEEKFRLKPFDIIIIAIAAGISLWFLLKPSEIGGSEKKLMLFAGDNKIELPFKDQSIDFRKDFYGADFKRYNIGRNITLEIKNKKARVISSDCPDKVCVNTGWSDKCGHMIICMPNSFGILIDCKAGKNANQ